MAPGRHSQAPALGTILRLGHLAAPLIPALSPSAPQLPLSLHPADGHRQNLNKCPISPTLFQRPRKATSGLRGSLGTWVSLVGAPRPLSSLRPDLPNRVLTHHWEAAYSYLRQRKKALTQGQRGSVPRPQSPVCLAISICLVGPLSLGSPSSRTHFLWKSRFIRAPV